MAGACFRGDIPVSAERFELQQATAREDCVYQYALERVRGGIAPEDLSDDELSALHDRFGFILIDRDMAAKKLVGF